MKIVLDSNVIIAAFVSEGITYRVFSLCLEEHVVYLSDFIVDEVSEKLRKKLKVPAKKVSELEQFLRHTATILAPSYIPVGICRDPDDEHILALARQAGVDLIITGDQDLLVLKKFGRVRMVTPREFYEKYGH